MKPTKQFVIFFIVLAVIAFLLAAASILFWQLAQGLQSVPNKGAIAGEQMSWLVAAASLAVVFGLSYYLRKRKAK